MHFCYAFWIIFGLHLTTIGRFTQADSYTGNGSDPITLHKYLYANDNPVNYTDPTGYFTMMDTTAAMSIRNILAEGQVGGYSKSVEILLNLISGVQYDSITDFVSIPGLMSTSLGLRLVSSAIQK